MKRILALLIFMLAALPLASAQRLPEVATPENYKLTFTPDLEKATFEGDETISDPGAEANLRDHAERG